MKISNIKVFSLLVSFLFSLAFIIQSIPINIAYASEGAIEVNSLRHIIISDEVKFSMKVQNSSNIEYKDLKYEAKLFCEFDNGIINIIDFASDKFSIGQNSSQVINFKFGLGEEQPKGTYFATIIIQNSSSVNIIREYANIGEAGSQEDYLLYINKSISIITSEGEVDPYSGANIEKGVSPKLKLKIKNTNNKESKLTPKVIIYQRSKSYNSTPVLETTLSPEFLQALEEKELILTLPSRDVPESYYIQVVFLNDENEIISGIIECRYVVFGISGKIITHEISVFDNSLHLYLSAIGPLAGSSLNNVTIKSEVLNADNMNEITAFDKVVTLSKDLVNISHEEKLNTEATNLLVRHTIIYENNTLSIVENKFTLEEITYNKPKPQPEVLLTDIENYIFKDSIIELFKINILNGYPDKTFRPENEITRAEFSVIMCYLLNKEVEAKETSIGDTFIDVEKTHWAGGFIKVLQNEGYIKGYPGNEFRPSNKITYAEAITVIVKILNNGNDLPDGSTWYQPYVNYANENSISSDFSFSPSMQTVRGEVAHMAYRAYNIINKY